MTNLDAFTIDLCEHRLFYTIDDVGNIEPMSRATYESLHFPDPRLHRVATSRRMAEIASLRVRGIETGFEVLRN